MAYNTKPIITDVDGNPISQYYNKELDQFEPVEGSKGANKVVLYNADGTENNSLSLIPILDKLSQLTGTVIDEETRKSNELQRIELYNQILNMLETGQLKGEKGDKGDTGIGLNFLWQGTSLGVKLETDAEYVFVDLRGPQGPAGDIDNLTSQHIETALGYTPVKSVNNVVANEIGNVELDIDTSEIENRIGNVEDDLVAHKADKTNPHGVTKSQVGLGSVQNYGIATQAEAQAGTSNVKYMTPLRVNQALAGKHITESGSNANGSYIKFDDGTMICAHSITEASVASDEVKSGTWVFPSAFKSGTKPALSLTLSSSSSTPSKVIADVATGFGTITQSSFGWVIKNGDSSVRTLYLSLIAIGRWK